MKYCSSCSGSFQDAVVRDGDPCPRCGAKIGDAADAPLPQRPAGTGENLGRDSQGRMRMTVQVHLESGEVHEEIIGKPPGYHPLAGGVGDAALEQIGPKYRGATIKKITTKRGGGGTIWEA